MILLSLFTTTSSKLCCREIPLLVKHAISSNWFRRRTEHEIRARIQNQRGRWRVSRRFWDREEVDGRDA